MATNPQAVIVGLRFGQSQDCPGCDIDVRNVNEILTGLGYRITRLENSRARKSDVLGALENAAATAVAGDIVVFFFAGHGGQRTDTNGDESDGKDETLVAYDAPIIDDELGSLWLKFRTGVRIVMISDSCNSGTNERALPRGLGLSDYEPASRPIRFESLASARADGAPVMKAQLIHIGGCQDARSSFGSTQGGNFTTALFQIFNRSGGFTASYEEFFKKIRARVAELTPPGEPMQWSNFTTYGPVAREFLDQRPFQVAPPASDSPAPSAPASAPAPEPTPSTPSTGSSDLWDEINKLKQSMARIEGTIARGKSRSPRKKKSQS